MGRRSSKVSSRSLSRGKRSIRVWLRLLSCEAAIEQRLRSLFREHFPVTLPQFDVLAELEHAKGKLTMSQLSKELMVSNGNITGVVDRLEKSGFVTRVRPSHDRRIQYIELTRGGAKEFKRMAAQHERWLVNAFSGMSIADIDKLQALLIKTRESVVNCEQK